MKRRMNTLACLLLAGAMTFSMAPMAMADEEPTQEQEQEQVVVATGTGNTYGNNQSLANHTFKAYQIFKGTQAEGSEELGDIEWGNGIDSDNENFISAVKNLFTDLANEFTAKDVAEKVAKTDGVAFAKIAYKYKKGTGIEVENNKHTGLDAGYYLVNDETATLGAGDAYNAALLQLTQKGDAFNINVKTDAPELIKKVKENTKTVSTENGTYNGTNFSANNYNDVADYNIGDVVPYEFFSKVPDMSKYDTYKFIIHDDLSAGLTFNNDVTVTIGKNTVDKSKYTVVTTGLTDGCDFEIKFTDLKSVVADMQAADMQVAAGATIQVDYTATLNKDAVIGLDGNKNTVKLEYSNNPNASGSGDNHPTGTTPEDKVIVFTYELDTTKIDGATANNQDPTKLAGAEFVFYKVVKETTDTVEKETRQYVTVDEDNKVAGWVPATAGEDGSYTVPTDAKTFKTEADKPFAIIGLDDGTYYLEETKAPAGYNKLTDPIEVKVDAGTQNTQTWTGTPSDALKTLTATLKQNETTTSINGEITEGKLTGKINMNIANYKGSTLPETGGIGTTIFYVVGSVLVLGAAILLVTKKRMSVNK